MYYECHITMEDFHKSELSDSLLVIRTYGGMIRVCGWSYSEISGDPSLGSGVRSYLTNHYTKKRNSLEYVVREMNFIARVLEAYGVKVVRQKVGLVVYDTKGKDQCESST